MAIKSSLKYINDFSNNSKNVFLSSNFQRCVKEKDIRSFFSNEAVLTQHFPSKERFKRELPHPVLYFLFKPLFDWFESIELEGAPSTMWSASNIWDPFSLTHIATQSLNHKCFNDDHVKFFDRIINKWLLTEKAKCSIKTITELILSNPIQRKPVIISKESINENKKLSKFENDFLIFELKEYSDILKSFNLEKIKTEMIDTGKYNVSVNNILADLKTHLRKHSNFIKYIQDVFIKHYNTKLEDQEIINFINLLFVFDLVTPVEWQEIMIFPAVLYTMSPIGGIFLVLQKLLNVTESRFIQLTVSNAFSIPEVLIRNFRIFDFAISTAVSAIMGRNMSHNIGSHVMARISTGSINGWTTGKSIDDIIKDLTDEKHKKNIIVWSKDVQYLSRYIQQRMDFIAQISTEWPSWTEPAYLMNDLMRWFLSQKHLLNHIAASEGLEAHSFMNNEEPKSESTTDEGAQPSEHSSNQKENIEIEKKEAQCNGEPKDEKKPGDIRFHIFMVHNDCWDNNHNVCKTVEERKNAIKIDCQKKKNCEGHLGCKPEKSADISNHKCRRILLYTPEKGDAECRMHEDIPLAIPGGIVGYHAFYIILENIIRNGAKHDYTRRKEEVGKHFDVVIEVLYDPEENIGIKKGDKRIPAHLFRIYNNTSKIGDGLRLWGDDSPKGMNNVLQTSIITETGELNKGNWGLAEMKIAAGYLQQRDISDIGDGKERITGKQLDNADADAEYLANAEYLKKLGKEESGSDVIIRAVESPIGTLGYEFYIPKPRTVGIVCQKEPENAQ